ncbi:MAG: cell wall hydrolase [Alphaproteobacteria bacterium]|nr:cell wall hydrolase [Alphaproteobacteria bacterium]
MNNKTRAALRQADRAVVGALFLIAGTLAARALVAPYTDNQATMPVAAVRATAVAAAAPAPAELARMQLLAEQRCLAEAMYYEARGEGIRGQEAVAEVVFHRVRSAGYPGTICGVVFEGAELRHACQFSFTCNGDMDRTKDPRAWAEARLLAAKIMEGAVPLSDMTEHAISYHATDVDPAWAGQMVRTVQIGNHIFYREPARSRSRGA